MSESQKKAPGEGPGIEFDPDVREETPRIVSSPRATGTWQGGMLTELQSYRHTYYSDEPVHRGGGDQGPTPLSVVMGGLCA